MIGALFLVEKLFVDSKKKKKMHSSLRSEKNYYKITIKTFNFDNIFHNYNYARYNVFLRLGEDIIVQRKLLNVKKLVHDDFLKKKYLKNYHNFPDTE